MKYLVTWHHNGDVTNIVNGLYFNNYDQAKNQYDTLKENILFFRDVQMIKIADEPKVKVKVISL